MPVVLTEAEILERGQRLPAFPAVVNDILATLEDENATLGALTQLVQRDPVIAARVLSIANSAALSGASPKALRDMHVAVSLIGLTRVREIVIGVSVAEFARESLVSSQFWEHSVAVGVAAQEFARFSHASVDHALVAGLLHDIGQLWMSRFYPLEYQMVRMAREDETRSLGEIEDYYFGMDHTTIGRILAEHWHLPPPVIAAIAGHHVPPPEAERLVAITHLAEVVCNALELGTGNQPRIGALSETACAQVGIDWSGDLGPLFGRIEGRARHFCKIFK